MTGTAHVQKLDLGNFEHLAGQLLWSIARQLRGH